MIEELKQLLTIIGSVPDMALNAFIMFGVYKLIVYMSTTAGIYGVLRLAINTWKEVKMKPHEIVMKGETFDLYSDDFKRIDAALRRFKDSGSRYMPSKRVDQIVSALDSIEIKDDRIIK